MRHASLPPAPPQSRHGVFAGLLPLLLALLTFSASAPAGAQWLPVGSDSTSSVASEVTWPDEAAPAEVVHSKSLLGAAAAAARRVVNTKPGTLAGAAKPSAVPRPAPSTLRTAPEVGIVRARDGRFLADLPNLAVPVLRAHVAEAVQTARPSVFTRGHDGRFVEVAAIGEDSLQLTQAAETMTDTIGTALFKAGRDLRAITQGDASATASERVASETKSLLRALRGKEALEEARKLSISRLEGRSGATLDDVDGVRLVEAEAQPAALWVSVRPAATRPLALVTRVNLDEVLAGLSRRTP